MAQTKKQKEHLDSVYREMLGEDESEGNNKDEEKKD